MIYLNFSFKSLTKHFFLQIYQHSIILICSSQQYFCCSDLVKWHSNTVKEISSESKNPLKQRKIASNIKWLAKILATDNACLPFFSCFETPKESTKCGMVDVPQNFVLNFFNTVFATFCENCTYCRVGARTSYLRSTRKNVLSRLGA